MEAGSKPTRLIISVSLVQIQSPLRWCSSMAEQRICNALVGGPTPLTSSIPGYASGNAA